VEEPETDDAEEPAEEPEEKEIQTDEAKAEAVSKKRETLRELRRLAGRRY